MEKTTAPNELGIEVYQIKKAGHLIRALNHSLRQQLLRLIHDNGRITVTQIYIKLRLEQSVASQHLAILRKAGFVLTERDGKFIFYTVNYNKVKEIQNHSASLLHIEGHKK